MVIRELPLLKYVIFVILNMSLLCDAAQRSLLDISRRFREVYFLNRCPVNYHPEDGGSKLLCVTSKHVQTWSS